MKEILARRFYWNVGNVGDGEGYSNKLSIKLIVDWRAWYVGGSYTWNGPDHLFIFIMFLPVGFRIHWARSWGGRYV
jgi:hypothetical protein